MDCCSGVGLSNIQLNSCIKPGKMFFQRRSALTSRQLSVSPSKWMHIPTRQENKKHFKQRICNTETEQLEGASKARVLPTTPIVRLCRCAKPGIPPQVTY